MSQFNSAARTTPNDQTTTIEDLKRLLQEFVGERNWQKYHTAKNLSMSIAIEAAELMEHFQWLNEAEASAASFDLQEVADELSDVACYVISMANALDLDLASSIHAKMVKNRNKYPASGQ